MSNFRKVSVPREILLKGERGRFTDKPLPWLLAREGRLILRREWADQVTIGGIKCALRLVRHDIENLRAQE